MENEQPNLRQGDVALRKITNIPRQAKKIENRILAYGEITGHHHGFDMQACVQVYQDGDTKYLEVYDESVLLHQGHNVFEVPKGTYEVVRPRELDEMAVARQVSD